MFASSASSSSPLSVERLKSQQHGQQWRIQWTNLGGQTLCVSRGPGDTCILFGYIQIISVFHWLWDLYTGLSENSLLQLGTREPNLARATLEISCISVVLCSMANQALLHSPLALKSGNSILIKPGCLPAKSFQRYRHRLWGCKAVCKNFFVLWFVICCVVRPWSCSWIICDCIKIEFRTKGTRHLVACKGIKTQDQESA